MLRRIIGVATPVLALVLVTTAPTNAAVTATATAANTATRTTTPYYLALGDSLSQGVQPTATGASVNTNQGYADDLYQTYRTQIQGLRLAKLGCSGETTGTMIKGGICTYGHGSQLADAVSFLKSHKVALVTIDIGANDLGGCVTKQSIDHVCISKGLANMQSNLPGIVRALRRAAAPGVPIFGMNYYDPFLATWLSGPAGQSLAHQSTQLTVLSNRLLSAVYAKFGIPVADVQRAFWTTDFRPLGGMNDLPINVAVICAWTWMCVPAPIGPNIHANAVGYAVITAAFIKTVGWLGHPAVEKDKSGDRPEGR